MGISVPVKPELISWALDHAEMSTADLKNAEKVESWIAGSAQPTLKQLQDFAKKVHVPFGYLMMSKPPVIKKPIPDFRVRAGSAQRYSAELTDVIYEQQRRQDWFRDYALEHGLEEITWVGSASLNQNPASVAQRLRAEWNYSTLDSFQSYTDSRKEVFRLLEDQGVLVSVAGYVGSSQRGFDVAEFSGFSLFDRLAPLVFVNGKESHAAQIFTMFHELGHLVLGETAVSSVDSEVEEAGVQASTGSERWCDDFAAEFLMPADEVRGAFSGSLLEDDVLRLARSFRASGLALLNRLRDLNLISVQQWNESYPRFQKKALEVLQKNSAEKSSGGNFYKTQVFVVGERFARAVYRDAASGRTSYPDAQSLLGVKQTQTFEKFAREVGA